MQGEGMRFVGEADCIEALVDDCARIHPDVILLDMCLPDGDGVDAIQQVRRACPATKVVIVTAMLDDPTAVRRAIASGADGFLSKTVTPEELVDAVRSAHEGLSPFSHDVTGMLVAPACSDRCAGLTQREQDTLALLSEGRSNSEIARELFISECTVKFHVRHIFEKLDVRNRVEATRVFRARFEA